VGLGVVELESPQLFVLCGLWKLCLFPVDERLGLDCPAGLVLDVVGTDLNGPLGDSTCGVAVADDVR
jgi:hypothetical protein